jgi:hypothetical protein
MVPGAAGVRAGMRFQLIANIWIALGLAVALDCWNRNASIEQLKQFPAYLNRWDSQQARNEGVSGH